MKDKDSVTVPLEREEAEAVLSELDRWCQPPIPVGVITAQPKLRAALNASPQSSDEARCGGSGAVFDSPAFTGFVREHVVACPGCPDCQSSDEEAGELASSLRAIADREARFAGESDHAAPHLASEKALREAASLIENRVGLGAGNDTGSRPPGQPEPRSRSAASVESNAEIEAQAVERFKERLLDSETIRDVYAGGPYGRLIALVDEGITPATAELSEDVYRRILRAAISSASEGEN